MSRCGLSLVMVLLWSMVCSAAPAPEQPSAWFCVQARAHRAAFASDKAAEDAARALGATSATIAKAHRCKRQ